MTTCVQLNKKEGFLGLTLGNNIDGADGVVVVKTKVGSLAERNHLVPGTVITRINGKRVNTHQEAVKILDEARDVVSLDTGRDANLGRVMASLTRGWVFKLSPRGHWQPRWLSIDVTRDVASLNYYAEPQGKPRGTIGAESIVGVRKGSAVPPDAAFSMLIPDGPSEWRHHAGERASFEVEVSSGRIFTFAAPTSGWCSEWIQSLTKLRFADRRAGEAPATAPAAAPAAAPPAHKAAARGKQAGYRDAIFAHVAQRGQTTAAAAAIAA